MFRCRNTQRTCIHIGNVCNGEVDCILGDDEVNCELGVFTCPQKCHCLLFAIDCQHAKSIFINTGTTQFLFLSISIFHCSIASTQYLQDNFQGAKFVSLTNSGLTEMCKVLPERNFIVFKIGFNNLRRIQNKCFSTLYQLQSLQINDNNISFIEDQAFCCLNGLYFLNLSNNPIHTLPDDMLFALNNIRMFNVNKVSFERIHCKAVTSTNLIVTITSDFQLCCTTPNETICLVEAAWHKYCSPILQTVKIRALFILVSVAVICPTIISFLAHLAEKSFRPFYSVTIMSINFDDFFCVAYLQIIWISDVVLNKNQFLLKEDTWEASHTCLVAFTLVLWFLLLSPVLLVFFSFSRLMVVLHPMDTRFKRTKFARSSVVVAYSCSYCVAMFISISFKLLSGDPPNSLCLPLQDPTNSFVAVKIFICFVTIYNIVSVVTILSLHLLLIKTVQLSKNNIRKSNTDNKSDTGLMVQLILISTSACLTWCPSGGVYILGMFLSFYPMELWVFAAFLSFPLNSVVNPVVFLGTTWRKLLQTAEKRKKSEF